MTKSRIHKPARLLLILLNINLLIFSFVLIIFGINEKSDSVGGGLLVGIVSSDDLPLSPSTIILTLGVLTIILAAYILHGVDNYCQLVTYGVLIIVFSVVDLSLGISAGFMGNSAQVVVGEGMMISLRRSIDGSGRGAAGYNGSSLFVNWSRLQQELKCCGVHGHEDWGTRSSAQQPDWIPGSCLVQGEDSITEQDLNKWTFVEEHVFPDGCLVKVVEQLGYGKLSRIGIILFTGKFMAGLTAGLIARIMIQEWNKNKNFV